MTPLSVLQQDFGGSGRAKGLSNELANGILPEPNIAPENRPLEKEKSYWKPPYSGAMLALGSVSSNNL